MKAQYEVKTKKTFAESVDAVRDSVQLFNFTILWEFDVKDQLSKNDLNFSNPFKIIEVCNPKRTKDVLDENILVGYLLPCKVVIYEMKEQVYIGMLNPTALVDLIPNHDLNRIAEDVENDLRKAIDLAAV
ncbi:MAG: DUF302 domain-containing protein [Tissierellales bacterium]|jgi:uncharacterized protein (DUF302 family)|nr:DUF302 domain-containing protein [Tissierellales bacterium]